MKLMRSGKEASSGNRNDFQTNCECTKANGNENVQIILMMLSTEVLLLDSSPPVTDPGLVSSVAPARDLLLSL